MLAITERKNEVNKLNTASPSCCQCRVRQHIEDITVMENREDRIQLTDANVRRIICARIKSKDIKNYYCKHQVPKEYIQTFCTSYS